MNDKITVNRIHLAAAMRLAAETSGGETGYAQVACVLLQAKNGTLRITSTDLTVTSVSDIPCKGDGEYVVDAERASIMVSTLDGESVTIERTDGLLTIKSSRRRNDLPVVGMAKDFPTAPSTAKAEWKPVSGLAVVECIEGAIGAASNDTSRFAICGVHLGARDGVMRGVGFNGHCLNKFERSCTADLEPGTVPRRACKVITSFVGDEDVDCWRSGHILAFRRDRSTLIVKLIDAPYQPWEDMLAKVFERSDREATFDRRQVLDVLARAKQVAGRPDKKEGAVPLWLDVAGKEARIRTANTRNSLGADDTLDVEHDGDGMKTACDPDYLVAALGSIGGEKVTLVKGGDKWDPLVFRRAGEQAGVRGGDFVLVMPMDRTDIKTKKAA